MKEHESVQEKPSAVLKVVKRVAAVMDRWEAKHPVSVYAAHMKRFRMIREQLPENLQKDPGMGWMEYEARMSGAWAEVGARIGDFFFNVIALPVTIVRGKWMKPVYSSTVTKTLMPDMVGDRQADGARTASVDLRITPTGFTHIGA